MHAQVNTYTYMMLVRFARHASIAEEPSGRHIRKQGILIVAGDGLCFA